MRAPVPFRVEVRPAGRRVVVAPCGEVDLETAGALGSVLRGLRTDGWAHVVLDTRPITFLDSSGLRVMLAERAAAQRPGHSFAIIDGSPPVARALEVSGLSRYFARAEPA